MNKKPQFKWQKAPQAAPAGSPAVRQLKKSGEESGSPQTPGTPGQTVSNANRWREAYNFLRGLVIARAVALLEAGERGDYPDLQLTYRLSEKRFATHMALVARCLAPLLSFDWEIKTVEDLPAGATQAMADEQAKTLRSAYDAVDNLREAFKHLALARFRGYAHIQKHRVNGRADDDVVHLECLPQWKFSRDGVFGDWFWNPLMQPTQTPLETLGEKNRIGSDTLPLDDFLVREVDAPVDAIALPGFIYTRLGEKDWAGFVEIYGIPSGVITMPQNVPKELEAIFQAAAKAVSEGGSGAIPAGSTYTANDSPRGVNPFRDFLKYWQEELVLAGTLGKLTMLAESGSGTLAGGAHEQTFIELAEGEAAEISEVFQRFFDADVLARHHAGQPALAYFEICAPDDTDVNDLVTNIGKLATAGYKPNVAWLNERTGYDLIEAPLEKVTVRADQLVPDPASDIQNPAPGIANRSGPPTPEEQALADLAADFQPLRERLAAIEQITDPAIRAGKLRALLADWETLAKDITTDPSLARGIQGIAADALKTGLMEKRTTAL